MELIICSILEIIPVAGSSLSLSSFVAAVVAALAERTTAAAEINWCSYIK
jgi:hypothetical protein